ncbi:MAG: CoA pyrophosphatase [Burkholderiales bacterium]|nr:CoA pyrophosphatase [Burkholderiales bacterium]
MTHKPFPSLTSLPNFDPRLSPVIGIDHHLPPVPGEQLHAAALQRRFNAPPVWAPEIFRERRFANREPTEASVLIPIVMRGAARDQPRVLLTQRTAHLSTHSGQIAFPGGKVDATDADARATALREAQEEVGLAAKYVEVIGTLPVYVTGTAFIVTPVVALVQPDYELQINPHEVDDAFEVPLDFLMNPANHHRHAVEWEGLRREWFSMPYRNGDEDRFIWGATAGMLRNFYRFLSA